MADVNNLYRKASRLHQQGRLPEAEDLYRKILAKAPNFIAVVNALGILAAQKGDYPAAVDCFSRVIEVAPDDLPARENLARACQLMGQYERAEAAYSHVLSVNPESYVALAGMGRALLSRHKYEQALAFFARAQAVNAGDPALYLNMGTACQQLARLDDASLHFRKALALAPDSIDANACLGHLLLQQQDYPSAEEHFRRAIDLGASRCDVEFGFAQTLEHRGEEAEAGKHYFRAVEFDPDSQNAYIQLDQFLLKSGGEAKLACLNELASDFIYANWQESISDLRKLAALYDYPDKAAMQALHAFMDDYDPGELHDRGWWQSHLDAFGGVKNGHDKLLRSLHSAVYCWSLPDRQSLTEVAAFVRGTRLCSYGAGSGVWERLLQEHFDVEVLASDITLRHRFLPMVQADYSNAEVEATDSIFLAWILRGDLSVLNILGQMRQGQKLVLIGEPPDQDGIPRICATPEMWRLLDEEYSLVRTIPLVSYSLLNDTVSLFVKG